jgi:biopolymer transport protein ExbB
MAAYKKEFAFLEAQKRALQRRLAAVETQAAERVAAAEATVDELQGRLITLRGDGDQEERRLREAERALPDPEEGDRVAETIDRALETLRRGGFAIAATPQEGTEGQAATLRQIFDRAAALVLRQGQTRVERGAFFTADGSRAEGDVVRVGAVAAFGVNRQVAGALAPAGGGRLKLWHQDAAATARALAAGRSPASLDLFLFENPDGNIEPKIAKSPLEVVRAGGLVAWVIVGLGGLAALLILARATMLLWTELRARGLVRRVQPHVARGDLAGALQICAAAGGPLARVLAATVAHLEAPRQRLEDHLSESMLEEAPRISRFGAAILVLAAVSPLLGLLGTVTGMISTFDIITEHGTGDPKLLSGGISEALITTELGLIVAIPTLLLGTLLGGWGRRLAEELERSALRLLNCGVESVGRAESVDGAEALDGVRSIDGVGGAAPAHAAGRGRGGQRPVVSPGVS